MHYSYSLLDLSSYTFHVCEELDEVVSFLSVTKQGKFRNKPIYELVVYAQDLVWLLCHVSNEGRDERGFFLVRNDCFLTFLLLFLL